YDREGIDAAFEQRAAVRARLAELETAMASAGTELAEGTARADFLARELKTHPNGVPEAPPSGANDPRNLVRSKVVELELQRGELLSKYAPTSLKIQEIDRQIEKAKQLLAEQQKTSAGGDPALVSDLSRTQAQNAAVKARIDALHTQIASYRAKLDH